jgi:hypothetical protein
MNIGTKSSLSIRMNIPLPKIDRDIQSLSEFRANGEIYEYKVSKSKLIIDQIDTLLAQHYGFTEEELDFIINYDIKYRMSKALFGEDDNG